MKNKFKYCLLFFCFVYFKVFATHIIGGEIFYEKLTGNDYKISLNLYRDCYNGIPPFDNPAFVTIFDLNGNVVLTKQLQLLKDTTVSLVNYTSNCVQTPTNICVSKGIYIDTVNLPPIIGGYTIAYQRCCRSASVLNIIINPGNVGATYWTYIPGSDVVATNNSPKFINGAPFNFCVNEINSIDQSATDIDGDSLVYFLTTPFDGLDGCCPIIGFFAPPPSPTPQCPSPPASCPTVNIAPPYLSIVYSSGYNSGYPISSSPAISINAYSGLITLTPNLVGDFAIGVGINEYRNQTLIGTYYRDFHTKVLNCSMCTNINELPKIELTVFPNPVSNKVTVSLNQVIDGGYYTITDIIGNIILTKKIEKNSDILNISEVTKGLYFLRINSKNAENVVTKKLVVE